MDKPAIAITRGAGVVLENLSIVGKNLWDSTYDSHDMATYNDDRKFTVNGSRDTRYSPYAGIAIDPYRYGIPKDGGYPGLSSWYRETNGSTNIKIKNCFIYGFTVGIVVSPNGASQNAEDIQVTETHIRSCKYGISVGQSQSRGCYVTRCVIQSVKWGTIERADFARFAAAFLAGPEGVITPIGSPAGRRV